MRAPVISAAVKIGLVRRVAILQTVVDLRYPCVMRDVLVPRIAHGVLPLRPVVPA